MYLVIALQHRVSTTLTNKWCVSHRVSIAVFLDTVMARVLCTATLLMRLANAGALRCTASIKFDRMLNMLIPRCRWRRRRDDRVAMVGHSEGKKADDRFSTGTTESHACRRNGFPRGLPLVDSSLSREEKESREEKTRHPKNQSARIYHCR